VIDLRNIALTPEGRLPVGYQNNRGFANVTVKVNKKILNLIDNDFYSFTSLFLARESFIEDFMRTASCVFYERTSMASWGRF